jgi:hypothetical protein
VDESTTRAPKISASFRIAVRRLQRRAHAQQHHFALHRRSFGQVGGLQHVDQLVHLLDHLRAQLRLDVHHDAHARERRVSVRATVRLSML